MEVVSQHVCKYVVKQFAPTASGNNVAVQLFVFNRDDTVGAYCWGDSETFKMLGEPPGRQQAGIAGTDLALVL